MNRSLKMRLMLGILSTASWQSYAFTCPAEIVQAPPRRAHLIVCLFYLITLVLTLLQTSPLLYGFRAASHDPIPPSAPVGVTIRIYNQVPVEDKKLQCAKAIAARVFKRVAVNVSWRDVSNVLAEPPVLDANNFLAFARTRLVRKSSGWPRPEPIRTCLQ